MQCDDGEWMDRGWDGWTGGGVTGLPSSKWCGDRDRWRPLTDRVSPSFHLRPHGKNPPSSHMQPYKRPWNAHATLQQDEGCTRRSWGGGGGADDRREESREAGQGNSDIGLSEKTLREEIRRVGKKHRGLEGCRK